MNQLRAAAREWLKNPHGALEDRFDSSGETPDASWKELWEDIRANDESEASNVSILPE